MPQDHWRFIVDGAQSGSWNMAVDQSLHESVEIGLSPPTVRLYYWKPPCLTFGFGQKGELGLDWKKIEEKGLNVARRRTGGRSVLHWGELTYSVTARSDQAIWCASRDTAYETLSLALLAYLKSLGIDAQWTRGVPMASQLSSTLPCFTAASRREIVWQGRKLVGSAQRRSHGALLQHGSILFDNSHLMLPDLFLLPAEEKRRLTRELRDGSISVEEILHKKIESRAALSHFPLPFFQSLGSPFEEGELTPWERERAIQLEPHTAIRKPETSFFTLEDH